MIVIRSGVAWGGGGIDEFAFQGSGNILNLNKNSVYSLITLKALTVWITPNWKILKEMRLPESLTCLLRNQDATVRTGHGTTDWIKIGKGI